MERKKHLIGLLLAACYWLTACGGGGNAGGAGDILGLNRRPPDEFLVVARPPLTLPPDFTLSPTAAETVGDSGIDVRQVIFGNGEEAGGAGTEALRQNFSESEYYLLRRAQAVGAKDEIRSQVDLETAQLKEEDESFIRNLLGTGTDFGTTLDAQEEYNRLQEQGITQ